jgi:glycosyltransferase involved in cell wall biosynthesis
MELLFIILFFVYLLIYVQKPKDRVEIDSNCYSSTVVAPFKNEKDNIRSLISSLNQHSEVDCEYVFVNNRSTDNTEELLQHELEQIAGIRFRIIHSKGDGKLAAISDALEYVDTDWVIVLDADMRVSSDTLQALSVKDEEVDVYFVPIRVSEVSAAHSVFQQLEYMAMNATSSIFSKNNIPLLISSAAIGMSKSLWEGFIREHSEHKGPFDAVLSDYLLRQNAILQFWDYAEASVETEGEREWEDFLLQRRKWGMAAATNWRLALYFMLVYAVNLAVLLGMFYGVIGRFYLLAKIALDVLFFTRWQSIYGLSFSTRQLVINAILYTPYILFTPIQGFLTSLKGRFTRK